MAHDSHNKGNKAVTLFATCLVVFGGAMTFCVVAMSNETRGDQSSALSIAGLTTLGIVVMLWLLRDRRDAGGLHDVWGWLARRKKRRVEYRPRLRRTTNTTILGTNAPPSVESIRTINAGKNVWNPAEPPKSAEKSE